MYKTRARYPSGYDNNQLEYNLLKKKLFFKFQLTLHSSFIAIYAQQAYIQAIRIFHAYPLLKQPTMHAPQSLANRCKPVRT